MSEGYVYILTNEAMPGLVKIGKTGRTPEQRASELYATGTPIQFEVFASVFSPNCADLERDIHEAFSEERVNAGREFFRCEAQNAAKVLKSKHETQIFIWLSKYLPHHIPCDPDHSYVGGVVCDISEGLGLPAAKLSEQLMLAPPDRAMRVLSRLLKETEQRAENG